MKERYIKPVVKTEIMESEVLMTWGSPIGGNPTGGGNNNPPGENHSFKRPPSLYFFN
jgi:hypothetical protein